MGRVCMGRLGYGPSLSWAEFVMGRDVQRRSYSDQRRQSYSKIKLGYLRNRRISMEKYIQ